MPPRKTTLTTSRRPAKGSQSSSTCRIPDENVIGNTTSIVCDEEGMTGGSSFGAKLRRKTRSLTALNNSKTQTNMKRSVDDSASSETQSTYFSDCNLSNKRTRLSRIAGKTGNVGPQFSGSNRVSHQNVQVAKTMISDDTESDKEVEKKPKLTRIKDNATRLRQQSLGASSVSPVLTSEVSVKGNCDNLETKAKGRLGLSPQKRKPQDETCSNFIDTSENVDSSASSDSEWEEVEELPVQGESPVLIDVSELPVQEKTVSISLPGPILIKKKKKSGHSEAFEAFRQILNRYRKRSQENLHKTHLLFLFSHGHWRNRICSDELLQSFILSIVPVKFCNKQLASWSLNCLSDFSKWFQQTIIIDSDNPEQVHPALSLALQQHIGERKVDNEHEHTLLFVLTCRAIGLETRIIFSLQPISSKPIDLIPKNAKLTDDPAYTKKIGGSGDENLLLDDGTAEKRSIKKLCPKDLKRWHELQRKDQKNAANQRQKGVDVEAKENIDREDGVSTQSIKTSDKIPQSGDKDSGKTNATVKGNQIQKATGVEVEEENVSGEKTSLKSVDKDSCKKKVASKRKQKNKEEELEGDCQKLETNVVATGEKSHSAENSSDKGKAKKNTASVSNSKVNASQKTVTAPPKTNNKVKGKVSDDDDDDKNSCKKNRKRRSCVSRQPKYVESSEDDESGTDLKKAPVKRRSSVRMPKKRPAQKLSSDEDFVVTSECESQDESVKSNNVSEDKSEEKKPLVRSGTKKKRVSQANPKLISDDDFDQSETSFRKTPTEPASSSQKRRTSKPVMLKSGSPACDWWAEVYLSKESRWICVNSVLAVVDQPDRIEAAATQPLSYVVAYNSDETVKDVTKKYASNWLSTSWKLRDDEAWWQQVLTPFESKEPANDEDQLMEDKLLSKPMPTTVGEFKNHPLYALQRHLLKFEAIYPPSAVPLGFIRGEPIFARECVQTLHAREKWIQEGHSVKDGEEPYKTVKARPKWNKSKEYNDSLKLALFGQWQTEPYVAPPAVDGKVPVNQYGNVDLYKPWMLPTGTVHLKDYPGLNRVARKLDIDCRQAMTGWDFHGASNHPVFEGWVVCEESVDVLVAAWREEQEIIKQKEIEKKEQRVNDNWKRLVKGLLILRRLKAKFQLDQLETVEQGKSKKGKGKTTPKSVSGAKQIKKVEKESPKKAEELESEGGVVDPALNWPQNRSRSRRAKKEDHNNLFPFEK